jgi:hypothetical protein
VLFLSSQCLLASFTIYSKFYKGVDYEAVKRIKNIDLDVWGGAIMMKGFGGKGEGQL